MFQFIKSFFASTQANRKLKNASTSYEITHKNITQKWKDMDKINDRITFASSTWCEYRAKMDLYFVNKKLLDLYQTLHRVLCETSTDAAFIDDVGSNEEAMDSFLKEIKLTVQFERHLFNITQRLRTELINSIKLAIGCIITVIVAMLYIYAKAVSTPV
jgi:nucleoside-triphosphatase THEP1